MCTCKLCAFKHKRTHRTKSPFMALESKKCNEITGPNCTVHSGRGPAQIGKKLIARLTSMLAVPFGYHFTRCSKKKAFLIKEIDYYNEFMIY